MNKIYLYTLLVLASIQFTEAQITITGTVTDLSTAEPLPGANVRASDELGEFYAEVQTDFDGNYSIEVKDSNTVLSFSFHEMLSKAIWVGDKLKIDAALEENPKALHEVVFVGSANSEETLQEQKKLIKELKAILKGKEDVMSSSLSEFLIQRSERELYEQFDFSEIDSLIICPPTGLTTLSDLSGSVRSVYSLDKKTSAKAKFLAFFNINYEEGKRYLVSDFVQYEDVPCPSGNGETRRYGVGVRLKISITNIKGGVEVNTPPQVAAEVYNSNCEASYTVETFGFSTKKTRKIMADLSGNFDILELVKVSKAEALLIESMEDDMKVRPKVVPINNTFTN